MVVVLGEVLGQLEPGELVLGRDPPDDPGTLEIDQMAVGRAPRDLRELAAISEMLTGWPGRGEQVDDGPPPGRVAQVDPPEPDLDELVQVGVGGSDVDGLSPLRSASASSFRRPHAAIRDSHRYAMPRDSTVSLVMRLSLTLIYHVSRHGWSKRRSGAGSQVLGPVATVGVVALRRRMRGRAASATAPAPGVINAVGAENQYANVLSQIGGRYVQVSSILDNPNTDPHTFEASTSVAEEVSAGRARSSRTASGYDGFMDKIESASPNPARKVIVAQHVLGLPDSTPNPHLWYDPKTMPAVAKVMAADLAGLDPATGRTSRRGLPAFDASLNPWLARHRRLQAALRRDAGGHHRAGGRLPARGHGHDELTPFVLPGRHHERRGPGPRGHHRSRTASSPSTRSRSSATTSRWSTR